MENDGFLEKTSLSSTQYAYKDKPVFVSLRFSCSHPLPLPAIMSLVSLKVGLTFRPTLPFLSTPFSNFVPHRLGLGWLPRSMSKSSVVCGDPLSVSSYIAVIIRVRTISY